jgi:uncharacterized protein (TIGR00106 family)
MPVVAEFSVTPLVEGQIRPFVDAAVEEVKKSGLKYEVDALGTTVEGELDQILEMVKRAHSAVRDRGAQRVVTELRIDDKQSNTAMEDELRGYR